jgi:hypothetical protein
MQRPGAEEAPISLTILTVQRLKPNNSVHTGMQNVYQNGGVKRPLLSREALSAVAQPLYVARYVGA